MVWTKYGIETCGKGDKKPRALTQMESSNDKSKMKSFFSDDDDDDDDDPIALKRQNDASKKKRQPDKLKGGDGLDGN